MNTRGKKNERGATAVEYGLLAAGVAAAIIMPMSTMGWAMGAVYEDSCKDSVHGESATMTAAELDQALEDCEG